MVDSVISASSTFEITSGLAGGGGTIDFGGPGATLLIDAGVTPTETIAGLQSDDFIDALGINGGTVTVGTNQLTIGNSSTSLTLTLDQTYGGEFRASPDGSGGTMVSYVANSQPYVVPIYHLGGSTNLIIYASLGGGPLEPYLLDSGSPNMFATYGAWWPGHTTQVTPDDTTAFTFANGTTYDYVPVPTDVSLGSGFGGTVVATASNVNIAQIISIVSNSTTSDFQNWATAVAGGGAPISANDTYGNFSAGLYGTNSLATVLAQIPIGNNLLNGFIIQAGGAGAVAGSLTVGLDPNVVAQWESNAATIVFPMDYAGNSLPNPDGNQVTVSAYQKAQIGDTTVTLTMGNTTSSYAIPTVIDTGGGPNNIIYNPGGTPDLSSWLSSGSTLENGITYDLSGTIANPLGTISSGSTIASLLDYVTSPSALSGGGNSLAISSTSIPGTLRVNPGITPFYNYNVMFDLQDGLVLFQPVTCFAAGTRITTERGLITVEELREDDLLPTGIGGALEPILWIGRRTVDCDKHPNAHAVWPVRIAAGAFAKGLPERDLYLSPDHAVYADGVLIPIKYLINGTTIVQVRRRTITYYHIELPQHDVVLAENLPVETYLDVHDRSTFDNGGRVRQLHPDFAMGRREAAACAELIVAGPIVRELQQRIAVRARACDGIVEGRAHARNRCRKPASATR